MRCMNCRKDKLSREFPRKNLSPACDHAALYCFRCTAEHVEQYGTCPGCPLIIATDDVEVKAVRVGLEKLFHGGTAKGPELVQGSESIRIALLDGAYEDINCSSETTIYAIKKTIEDRLKHPRQKQRLLYKGTELQVMKKSNAGWNTLEDYSIPTNSTIHLLIVLYDIPEDLDHVIFDIYWKVPPYIRCDFLDASCLLFDTNQKWVDTIDYANETGASEILGKAVFHSGDLMDRVQRVGQHRIEVKLKSIPENITHLVFILSAWNSKEIQLFGQPTLRFCEATNIFKHLCEKALSDSIHKQAVVVCCVHKTNERWTIFESGQMCDGNTDDYDAIKRHIQNEVLNYL